MVLAPHNANYLHFTQEPDSLNYPNDAFNKLLQQLAKNGRLKKLSFDEITVDKTLAESLIFCMKENREITHLGFGICSIHKKASQILRGYLVKEATLLDYIEDINMSYPDFSKINQKLETTRIAHPHQITSKIQLVNSVYPKLKETMISLLTEDLAALDTRKGPLPTKAIVNTYQLEHRLNKLFDHWKGIMSLLDKMDDNILSRLNADNPGINPLQLLNTVKTDAAVLKIIQTIIAAKIMADEQSSSYQRHSSDIINQKNQIDESFNILFKKTREIFVSSQPPEELKSDIGNLSQFFNNVVYPNCKSKTFLPRFFISQINIDNKLNLLQKEINVLSESISEKSEKKASL